MSEIKNIFSEGIRRAGDKMLSGRFIILIVFGFTICGLSLITLNAITTILTHLIDKDMPTVKEILGILKDILIFLLGHLTGAFSKIWDGYNHRPDRLNNKQKENQ